MSTGRKFLDAGVRNALLQPAAVDEGIRQRFIARLLERFPARLSTCYLLHSVNEATEVALRLARAHRPGKDVIVLDDADYGLTTSLANMSPGRRKFWVQVASRVDAQDLAAKARVIEASGRGLCGFFAEGVFADGYLREAYAAVRAAGGLNVAIEAQTGMGRVGPAFWEFARQQAEPDIVVVGDSLGDGFPIAAVVTTPELAAPFRTGSAGSPAACMAGLAVLEAVRPPEWSPDFSGLGLNVRGAGLCFEIDVTDGPGTVARLRDRGILIAARANTLLFRPPLTFTRDDASKFIEELRACV